MHGWNLATNRLSYGTADSPFSISFYLCLVVLVSSQFVISLCHFRISLCFCLISVSFCPSVSFPSLLTFLSMSFILSPVLALFFPALRFKPVSLCVGKTFSYKITMHFVCVCVCVYSSTFVPFNLFHERYSTGGHPKFILLFHTVSSSITKDREFVSKYIQIMYFKKHCAILLKEKGVVYHKPSNEFSGI
jgi:hypothetical protein